MRLAVRWPWPCAAAESGFPVTFGCAHAVLVVCARGAGVGIDVDPSKVDAIREGRSYISDIPSDRLARVTVNPALAINHSPIHQFTINHSPASALTATTDYSLLAGCDVAIICVPTPLNKTRDPDVRFLIAAGESVAQHIHPGMLVVLESTTYPGTTEELLLPMLEAGIRGQKSEGQKSEGQKSEGQKSDGQRAEVGVDFFLAFSPERIDPGRTDWTVENTPKVVGGMTPACLEVATALDQQAVDRVVPVSSPAAAEMTKLLASRNTLPRGQHRHGQRGRDHVRQAGHRRVGGDRRSRDQALRLHEVHARTGRGRPVRSLQLRWTASRWTRITCRGS